jgi:hypothetical protein
MDTDIDRVCESCPWLRVRILRQIAHLRSYTLLFALADVPEDYRIIDNERSAINSERQPTRVQSITPAPISLYYY